MQQDLGSFRDQSGYVYYDSGDVLRTIMPCYKDAWQDVTQSGLIADAVESKLLVPFEEHQPIPGSWKTLKVEKIPFISYPYEWSFSQLKDAALLTLELQAKALDKSMVLKDASAYNVQFVGHRPVFIDLLSFEPWQEGDAWQAYRQYCMHFLAPLTLAARLDFRCSQLSRQWIDGIPLDIACSMLPWKAKLSPGLFMHLFLHAAMQSKYADPRDFEAKKGQKNMTLEKVRDIVDSLVATTNKQQIPGQMTEWGDYYNDTNYSDAGTQAKLDFIEAKAKQYSGDLAVDMGANSGRFSLPLSQHFQTVVSADIDPVAVDMHYRQLKENGPDNILPIVLDLSSPTPSLGWASQERMSFVERCDADMVLALALFHHLFFTVGVPFTKISEFFASILRPGGVFICEYVPREDGQVQRMLSARDDVFDGYTKEEFNRAFKGAGFRELEVSSLPDSVRTLHVFQKVS